MAQTSTMHPDTLVRTFSQELVSRKRNKNTTSYNLVVYFNCFIS